MNPVLRDSLQVFFGERHGLLPYFYLLAFLAPIEFLALCTPFLGSQMWSGAGNLVKVVAAIAVLLTVYFALRVANREYAPSRFKPLAHWLSERRQPAGVVARGQVEFLAVHAACSLFLIAPLLVWAAAISRVAPSGLALLLALIPFYALCYGVWGLAVLALWEHKPDNRELIVRGFIGVVVLVAMAVYLPLNPVAYLFSILDQQEPEPFTIGWVRWPADYFHFAFHLAFGAAGLAVHRWALERGR